MKKRRTAARVTCVSLRDLPLAMLCLAAFFIFGMLLGAFVSARCAEEMGAELRSYLDGFLTLRSARTVSFSAVMQTLVCFFRAPVLVFLLGFASVGVVLIPLVCAAQGFLFSFALHCFFSALGRGGFVLLVTLFALRLLLVLPCTLLLGSAGWETSRALAVFSLGGGKRVRPAVYGRCYWLRFAFSCVCLLFGAVLELCLVPWFLALFLR